MVGSTHTAAPKPETHWKMFRSELFKMDAWDSRLEISTIQQRSMSTLAFRIVPSANGSQSLNSRSVRVPQQALLSRVRIRQVFRLANPTSLDRWPNESGACDSQSSRKKMPKHPWKPPEKCVSRAWLLDTAVPQCKQKVPGKDGLTQQQCAVRKHD